MEEFKNTPEQSGEEPDALQETLEDMSALEGSNAADSFTWDEDFSMEGSDDAAASGEDEDIFAELLHPEQSAPEDVILDDILADEILQEVQEDAILEDALADQIVEDVLAEEASDAAGHDRLSTPELGEEITADEHAMSAHDLTHPSEAEPAFQEAPFPDEAFRDNSSKEEFQAMFDAAPEEESAPSHKVRPARKGRPKRKKGAGLLGIPHLIATAIWLMIIVAIGVSLGRMIWVCAADALAFGRESKKATVTITASDTNEDIAEKLHDAGLVRYPGLFKLYADLAIDEGEIIPGTYELDTIYDYMALTVQMSNRSSSREEIEVLIPEGLNCRQIFELLEENKVCTVAELEEYAANGELEDYWFLEGVERGDKYCLEGFLFPDTYNFYVGGSARHTLEKMLSGFEYRYTEEIHAMLPTLNERLSAMMRSNGCSEDYIAAHQMDLRDVITVASLIEEETASVTESPTIASVIYNRLTQDQEYERYLGIDATIIYALGEHKEELTAEDLAIDSPYNTRLYAGLTPGPISNPGLDSIKSALNPADTKYYYYVLNPETHLHSFSETYEEHEQKVEQYRGTE